MSTVTRPGVAATGIGTRVGRGARRRSLGAKSAPRAPDSRRQGLSCAASLTRIRPDLSEAARAPVYALFSILRVEGTSASRNSDV